MLLAYAAYTLLAVTLVTGLARTLFRDGAVFLQDVFGDRPELAEAVNRLLVTGFFMLNLGYAALIIKLAPEETTTGLVEALAQRLGLLLVSLAVIHFTNLGVFAAMRRRASHQLNPAVAPSGYVAAAPGQAWTAVR